MFKLDQLVDKIIDYFKVKLDLIKLDMVAQGSEFIIRLLSLLVVACLSLFFVFFLSMGMVILINIWLENVYAGYFIMSGFFGMLMLVLFILFKKGVLQGFLAAQLMKESEKEIVKEL